MGVLVKGPLDAQAPGRRRWSTWSARSAARTNDTLDRPEGRSTLVIGRLTENEYGPACTRPAARGRESGAQGRRSGDPDASPFDAEVPLLDVHMRIGLQGRAVRFPVRSGRGREVVAERDDQLLLRPTLLSQHGDRGAERAIRYLVAFGPVLPGVQRPDVQPVLADDGRRGVESVDRVRRRCLAARWFSTAAAWRSTAGAVRCRVRAR